MPKCCICKKDLKKEEAYMFIYVSKTGKEYRKYACSQEEVENDERDKELYKKIQYISDEILGYPCVNNTRNKKIKELQEVGYSNEVIYRCFKEYKDEIIKWIDTNKIDKEYNKIAYMFAVIGANIKDFSIEDEKKNDWNQYTEDTIEEELFEGREETDGDIIKRLKNKKDNKNNISSFLDSLK